MRLRRWETVLPWRNHGTDSEFALRRVIICAVLTALSAFRPMLPLGSRTRAAGAQIITGRKLIAADGISPDERLTRHRQPRILNFANEFQLMPLWRSRLGNISRLCRAAAVRQVADESRVA